MATISIRRGVYYLSTKIGGQWTTKSLYTKDPRIAEDSLAAAQAREITDRRKSQAARGIVVSFDLAEISGRFIAASQERYRLGQCRLPTAENVAHRTPIILNFLKSLGVVWLDQVSRATVRQFVTAALAHPYSPTTVNQLCALASQLWEFALEDDTLADLYDKNPWAGKKLRPRAYANPKPALTPEEYVLAKEASHKAQPVVRFLVFMGAKTGRRISSLLRLKESDFCAESRTISVYGKGKHELVNLDEEAVQFLLDWPVGESGFYCPQISQPQASARVGEFFKRLRRQHQGKFIKASHHSFRRTAGTALRVAQVDGRVAADALGHSSLHVHERHYVDERARRTGSTLADALRVYEKSTMRD